MKYSVRLNMDTNLVEGSRSLRQVNSNKPWGKKEVLRPVEIVDSPDLEPSDNDDDVILETSKGQKIVKLWDISEDLQTERVMEMKRINEVLKDIIPKLSKNDKALFKIDLQARLDDLTTLEKLG